MRIISFSSVNDSVNTETIVSDEETVAVTTKITITKAITPIKIAFFATEESFQKDLIFSVTFLSQSFIFPSHERC